MTREDAERLGAGVAQKYYGAYHEDGRCHHGTLCWLITDAIAKAVNDELDFIRTHIGDALPLGSWTYADVIAYLHSRKVQS